MNAEHRKELETNTLADTVGGFVSRAKHTSRRAILLFLVVAVVGGIGALLIYRSQQLKSEQADRLWYYLYDGGRARMNAIVVDDPQSPAGKAARFQNAWINYWEDGIKKLGFDPHARISILNAEKEYSRLVEDCKDDPEFMAEALYGLAVIEETRAAIEGKLQKDGEDAALTSAVEKYKEISSKYKTTPFAKLAENRVEALTDKDGSGKISDDARKFYRGMQFLFAEKGFRPGMPGMPK